MTKIGATGEFPVGELVFSFVNEFVPKKLSAKASEKVTWTFTGGHTISFNVPKYSPVFTIADDGTVEDNPKARVRVDADEWGGKGFRSSGLDYSDGDEFSVTFTRSGIYPFACLVHPAMVGTIVVK